MCIYVTVKVGGLAGWAKAIATKPDDLIPGTCMVRESILSCKLSSVFHVSCACMRAHKHTLARLVNVI